MLTIQSNGMHLIAVSERSILVRNLTHPPKLADRPVHGMHALERDNLGGTARQRAQHTLQMAAVVVSKYVLGRLCVPYALNHARVVALVAHHVTAGQHARQRVQCGVVGHVARGEEKGSRLAVQPRELLL